MNAKDTTIEAIAPPNRPSTEDMFRSFGLLPAINKESNPKDSVGVEKVPMSTVSGPVLMEVGLGMLDGACKYGRHNYRVSGVRGSVYYDASMRHMMDWWEGTDIDPDSGIHHVSKAIATLVVLRDAMIQEKFTDDRPPKTPPGWIQEMNKVAKSILDRYPEKKEAYTQKRLEDYPI